MAIVDVKFKRKTQLEIDALPIEDGSIIFNTDKKEILMDNGSVREKYSGNVETDKTLTKENVSADAKAVGDKIEKMKKILLPNITAEDEGKFLKVKNGNPEWEILPSFNGTYEYTPKTVAQSISTAGKLMEHDLTIKKIPTSRTGNGTGGDTFYIAKEI